MVSATAPKKALERADFLQHPEVIKVEADPAVLALREDLYRMTPFRSKVETVRHLARRLAVKRGLLFISPGERVYSGMVVGQNPKNMDIEVNVCKRKQMTNTRASGSDEALKLVPHKELSLEQALDFIETDELVEITPKHIRMRKKILDPKQRMRANKK